MSRSSTPSIHRTVAQIGSVLAALAVLLAIVVTVLVLGPARTMTHRGAIGSTLVVEVPADRSWAVYSTLSAWRAAACDVSDADGNEIVLQPDMTQQRLHGWPTWYPQGIFRLDQAQTIAVRCAGPPGQFAVGPSIGFGNLLLALGTGLLGVLLAVAGLILLIAAAAMSRRSESPRPPR